MDLKPKIDFYVLEKASYEAALALTCKLIETIFIEKKHIYILTSTKEEAEHLNDLLWTYREDSFLPHDLYGKSEEFPPPIQIGSEASPNINHDILCNLSPNIPASYKQFNRIIEIVYNDLNVQQLARERYKRYRADACEIETIKL